MIEIQRSNIDLIRAIIGVIVEQMSQRRTSRPRVSSRCNTGCLQEPTDHTSNQRTVKPQRQIPIELAKPDERGR